MKVCLIAVSSLRVAPYVKQYFELLSKYGVKCDIISKEHESEKDSFSSNDKKLIYFYKDAKTPFQKIKRFFAYADFVDDVICSAKYEKMIVFDPFYAVIYYMRYRMNFFKRMPYILDIRDYNSRLSNLIMKYVLKKIMKNAYMITVSSSKFKVWLPNVENMYTMHNIPLTSIAKKKTTVFLNKKIRIAYLGGIGYFEQNKEIVEKTYNTDIELMYAGVYPLKNNIKDYCKEYGYDKVLFYGKYNDQEKDKLYENVDIINAVYGNESLVVTTALPNKLYDCAFYKIPIMVNSGTYLEEIVNQYNIGFAIDPFKDDIRDKIFSYKEKFNKRKFDEGCDNFLKDVLIEQGETEKKILEFLENCSYD